jgi:hypothetical protein
VGPFARAARSKRWGIFVSGEKRLINVTLGRAASAAPISRKAR